MPIPWRYYLADRPTFEQYLASIKTKYPELDTSKAQFRLFETTEMGEAFVLP
jgi:hypothetical protein